MSLLRKLALFGALFSTLVLAEFGEVEDPNSEVVVLSDGDFLAKVVEPREPYFVQFYAPWCGHCRRMNPAFEALAKMMKGETHIGKVDCTINTQLKDKFHIRGFPTLKLFNKGRIYNYEGPRTQGAWKAYLEDQHAKISEMVALEKHTLRSFAWRGDTEPIRLALQELGVKYEDVRYSTKEEWEAEKQGLEKQGLSPFGQLPSLTVGDTSLSMTGVILRHLGRVHEMSGKSEDEKAFVDTIICDFDIFMTEYSKLVHAKTSDFDEAYQNYLSDAMPAWVSYADRGLARSKEIWPDSQYTFYFVGPALTVADLCIFHLLSTLLGLNADCLKGAHQLREWFVTMGTRDNLNKYFSSPQRPQYMHGPTARLGNAKNPLKASSNPFRAH